MDAWHLITVLLFSKEARAYSVYEMSPIAGKMGPGSVIIPCVAKAPRVVGPASCVIFTSHSADLDPVASHWKVTLVPTGKLIGGRGETICTV